MSRRLLVAVPLFAACTGNSDAPKLPDPPPPAAPLVDAPVMDLQPSGVFDPAGGRHLDDDVPPPPTPVVPARPSERNPRAQRPIDLTLRSVPPGAMAAVDGVPIGPTPTYWAGDANGRVHEFTFVLAHYSVARYRFVPVTSGILFARLDAVAGDESPPSTIPPIPLAVPGLAPPPPVPTVIAPAPRPPPPPPVDARIDPPPADAAEPSAPASDAAAPSGTLGPSY